MTMAAMDTTAVSSVPPAPTHPWRQFLRAPLGVVAAAYLLVVAIACFAAPLIAPYDPLENDLGHGLEGPSSQHWLGTDQLGRDVLSRLLYGGQSVFIGVLEAAAISLVIGVSLGLVSGYHGGRLDSVVSRIVDVWLSLPGIVVLLLVLAVFGSSQTYAMVTLGILLAPTLFRVARGAAIATRHELYVSAARVFGLTSRQIIVRHLVPRITGPVVVNTSILMGNVVLLQSGLAFLGLTVQPPHPSWGGMITEASQLLQQQPWLIVPSGLAIALTVLAFVLLGDAIRDASQEIRTSTDGRLRTGRRTRQHLTPEGLDGAAPDAARDAILRVRDMSVALPMRTGWTVVVDKVSFDVKSGETVGLVGESGCGKSVTALAVLGLVPGSGKITSGSITLDRQDLTALSPKQYRALRGCQIAYISQEPMSSLDPSFTIGSQMTEAIRQHENLGRSQAKARALELLARVGLAEPERVAKQFPHQVSGGMAQRVVIARALAGRPQVLIADEPTTALDSTVQQEILKLLLDIQRETGMAIILVTHDWGVVAHTCDRAVVMYAGQVVEQATVERLFTEPGHPYTAALLRADPHRADRTRRLDTIDGTVPAPRDWPVGCRFAARCQLHDELCDQAPVALHVVSGARVSRCIRVGTSSDATVPVDSLRGVS